MDIDDLVSKDKRTCSHNWIHNAGEQCRIDVENKQLFNKFINKKRNQKGDSNNIAYMYICTMCGQELWSSNKLFDIPHYRAREV